MLQQPDIIAHLVGACRDSRKYVQHSCIHLPGIGLTGYRITRLKSHLFCDHRIDLVNRLLIAVKKF